MVDEGLGLGLGIKLFCENSVGLRRKELPAEISRSRQTMLMVRRTRYPRSSKGEKKSPVEMEAGHVVGSQEEIFSKLQEL